MGSGIEVSYTGDAAQCVNQIPAASESRFQDSKLHHHICLHGAMTRDKMMINWNSEILREMSQ